MKTLVQKVFKSTMEEIPNYCAVKAIGLIGDWILFGSKSAGVAHSTGLGV